LELKTVINFTKNKGVKENMKTKDLLTKSVAIAFTCAMLIGTTSLSYAMEKRGFSSGSTATPAGFKQMLLYMGTGIYDPNEQEPRPGVTGCTGLFCDGDYFQKEIMNRTVDEIAQIKNDAKVFFFERFGIDVDDPANTGRVQMEMFTVNPDFEYRVQMASEMKVSSDGWMIRDGGFRLDILDPEGYELGGESQGSFAPAGSAMFFGNYNILATNKRGNPKKEIIISYKSKFPAFSLENGSFIFICDMFNEEWGDGLGMGNIRFIPLDDGRIRGNGRNVLSFPPSSDLDSFAEFPLINAHP